MPHVRIEIVKGRSVAERRQLFQAVHDALIMASQTSISPTVFAIS